MISNNSCKKLQETANTPRYLQKELLIVFVVDLRLFVFKIYSILKLDLNWNLIVKMIVIVEKLMHNMKTIWN